MKLCAHFDGGNGGDKAAAYGWLMQGRAAVDASGEVLWITLAWASVLLDARVTTVEAELEVLYEATYAILSWAKTHSMRFENFRVVRTGNLRCDSGFAFGPRQPRQLL